MESSEPAWPRQSQAANEGPMKIKMFAGAIVIVALAVVALGQPSQPAVASARQALKTPWGDPDISGLFTTDDELGVPFERPAQFGNRQYVTAEEFAQRQTQSERQDEADRESLVAPRPQQAGGPAGGR